VPTLAERLVEAENAYHQLVIGGQPVEIRDSSGESIRYTMANGSRLRAYIEELKREIAGQARRPPPLRPVWG
jgi:hypothetical protein